MIGFPKKWQAAEFVVWLESRHKKQDIIGSNAGWSRSCDLLCVPNCLNCTRFVIHFESGT
jgi:hypothetical protein